MGVIVDELGEASVVGVAPADAVVPGDEGGAAVAPGAGATFAPCLEPKIADTMLPKTLMLSSNLTLVPASHHSRRLIFGREPAVWCQLIDQVGQMLA
jgi:hypothetical protein